MKNTCSWITSDDSPAGMPSLHAEEQQAELEHADREAVGDDAPPRHVGRLDEEDGRHRREQEAQRRQRERRHARRSADLIGTNVKPHTTTTASVEREVGGAKGGRTRDEIRRKRRSERVPRVELAFQMATGGQLRSYRLRRDRPAAPAVPGQLSRCTTTPASPPAAASTSSASAASRVDFYAQQIGARLEDVTSFAKYLGGSSANTAFGCARLGLKAAMVSRVGDDAMGRFLVETIAREGCDVSHVSVDPHAPHRARSCSASRTATRSR